MVQKGIGKPHGADQRQHHPQLVKAQAHRNPRRLKQQHRVQHHNHKPGKIIFGKGYPSDDIENRYQQLAQGIQPVDRGISCGQGVHLPQFMLGLG